MEKTMNTFYPPKNGRRSFIAGIAACVILAALLILLFREKITDHLLPASGGKEQYRTVILYGNDNEKDFRILEETLKNTLDRNDYSLTAKEGCAELRLRDTLVSNANLVQFLEYFIVEPGQWHFTCDPSDGNPYTSGLHTIERYNSGLCTDARIVDPSSISSVNSQELPDSYSLSGEEVPLLSFTLGQTSCIRLEFTDEVAQKLHFAVSKGSCVYLCRSDLYPDCKTHALTKYGWELRPDETDSRVFYIDYNVSDILYGNEKLFLYLLGHEVLTCPYEYCIADEINWEDPRDNVSCGTYQCSEEEFADSWYLFTSTSTRGVSEQEKETTVRLILHKMDLLKSPYALGYTADGTVCIKTQSPCLNAKIIPMITENHPLYLRSPDTSAQVTLSYAEIRYDSSSGSINVTIPEATKEELHSALSQSRDHSGESEEYGSAVFLYADDIAVAACRSPFTEKDNTLSFADLAFSLPEEQGNDFSWLAALLQDILNSPDSFYSSGFDYYCFHNDKGDSYNDSSAFILQDRSLFSLKKAEDKIKKILPSASIKCSNDAYNILIELNLEPDGDLVEKIFTLCPGLLEAALSEAPESACIRIVPCAYEKDERAWLIFERSNSDKQLEFSGFLFNGRFDTYTKEIEERMKTDTFFSPMSIIEDPSLDLNGWILQSSYVTDYKQP